jgi:uncharacterized protein
VFVIYHNDLDGELSASLVCSLREPEDDTGRKIFHRMDYKDSLPFDQILKDEEVWIVDFSLSTEELLKLPTPISKVYWIDHHVSAMERHTKEVNFGKIPEIAGLRDKKYAACVNTYKYLKGNIDMPLTDVPYAVRLVGDHDAWRFEYREAWAFFYGATIYDTGPQSSFWYKCLWYNGFLDDVVKEGEVIKRYKQGFDSKYIRSWGFETKFKKHKAYAINLARCGSQTFGELIDQYDVCISFVWDGNLCTISLYSVKIDVSKLATEFGGGGHKGAAGFTLKEIPSFLVKE